MELGLVSKKPLIHFNQADGNIYSCLHRNIAGNIACLSIPPCFLPHMFSNHFCLSGRIPNLQIPEDLDRADHVCVCHRKQLRGSEMPHSCSDTEPGRGQRGQRPLGELCQSSVSPETHAHIKTCSSQS